MDAPRGDRLELHELLEPAEQQLFTSLAVFVGGFTLGAADLAAEQPDLDIRWRRLRPCCGTTSSRPNEHAATNLAWECSRPSASTHSIVSRPAETPMQYGVGTPTTTSRCPRRPSQACSAHSNASGSSVSTQSATTSAPLSPGPWIPARRTSVSRIGAALWRYSQLRSLTNEIRERLQELLALDSGSPATRAKAQTMLASLALSHGDRETARWMLEESLAVHRQERDAPMVANALGLLGWAALDAGETDSALALTLEAHGVARGGASPYHESASLWQVGVCLAVRGEFDDADERHRGGRRPGTEARKCPERRWVEEVTRGHCVDARRSRAGQAAVR